MMVIKPDKGVLGEFFLLFLSTTGASVLLVKIGSWIGAIILFLYGAISSLCYWMALGRTLVFSEKGLEVRFLWIVRTYAWEQIKARNYVDCTNSIGHRSPYTHGAEFQRSCPYRPKWLKPGEFSIYVRPWSYVFVYFPPKNRPGRRSENAPRYEVDETTFRNTMSELGIL